MGCGGAIVDVGEDLVGCTEGLGGAFVLTVAPTGPLALDFTTGAFRAEGLEGPEGADEADETKEGAEDLKVEDGGAAFLRGLLFSEPNPGEEEEGGGLAAGALV